MGKSPFFDFLKIDEVSVSLSGLAIQGPLSCSVLSLIGFATIEKLNPFEIKNFTFNTRNVTVARVGFTADLGYELRFEPELNKNIEKVIKESDYYHINREYHVQTGERQFTCHPAKLPFVKFGRYREVPAPLN